MSTTPSTPALPQLDVLLTIESAWRGIRENRRALAVAVSIPLCIQIAMVLVSSFIYQDDYSAKEVWVLMVIQALASVLVAVRCHRILLLREAGAEVSWIPRWTWNDTRFALASIALMAAFFVAMLATFVPLYLPLYWLGWYGKSPDGPGHWLMYLLMVPALYVTARLVLALPIAAVKTRIELGKAWSLSRESGWALTFLSGGIPLLIGALTELGPSIDKNAAINAVIIVITNVCVVFEIAVISMAYRTLAPDEDHLPAPAQSEREQP